MTYLFVDPRFIYLYLSWLKDSNQWKREYNIISNLLSDIRRMTRNIWWFIFESRIIFWRLYKILCSIVSFTHDRLFPHLMLRWFSMWCLFYMHIFFQKYASLSSRNDGKEISLFFEGKSCNFIITVLYIHIPIPLIRELQKGVIFYQRKHHQGRKSHKNKSARRWWVWVNLKLVRFIMIDVFIGWDNV